MKLPLYQVDAFTNTLFRGNPAAVVLLDEWLPDDVLAAIAAENNLAETAYVIPRGNEIPLRWFTPKVEVDLCGHATLAAAHVLFKYTFPQARRLVFNTPSGNLAVERDGDWLQMDFPARSGTPLPLNDELIAAIGARPSEVYLSRDILAIFDSEEQVRAFQPDYQNIARLDAFALIIAAPGEQVDYVYRFFAPRQGIPEDPVTGSANCTLAPYWASRLGKPALTARQLSPRGGEMRCVLRDERVLIAGQAIEYLRGEIDISAVALA